MFKKSQAERAYSKRHCDFQRGTKRVSAPRSAIFTYNGCLPFHLYGEKALIARFRPLESSSHVDQGFILPFYPYPGSYVERRSDALQKRVSMYLIDPT
jgi:hypothetical protein